MSKFSLTLGVECGILCLECGSLENLKERLQKVISQAGNSVGIYRICGECKKFIVILGQGMVTQEPNVYVI